MEWDAGSITKIIKACAEGGVSKFKLSELEISFPEKQDTMEKVQEVVGAGFDQVTFRPVSEEEEQLIKQMRHDELLISDPLAYENSALGEDASD